MVQKVRDMKQIVGDMFATPVDEVGNVGVVLPYQLMTGEPSNKHYQNTILKPYVARRLPNANKNERDAFELRLKSILKILKAPMVAFTRVYLERRIFMCARRLKM